MPDQLQLRGGTTTEHNSFTGVAREVTVDTTKKTLVVHDGASAGGTALMKESGTVDPTNITIGTGGTQKLAISNSEVVFNDTGADVDFRIESDDVANMFCVDASSNQIGIGTATPGKLLHLNVQTARTNDVEHMMLLTHSSSGTTTTGFGTGFRFQGERHDGALQNIGEINFIADVNSGSNLSSSLLFRPAVAGVPNTHMIIDSDGHVGINDTSPSVTLDITGEGGGNGEINVKRTSGASAFIQAQSQFAVFGSNSNHKVQLKSNNTTALTIDTSQRIGIGTSDPTTRFTLVQSTDNSNGGLSIFDSTANSSFRIYRTGAGQDSVVSFQDRGTDVINIKNQLVGIGTTSPDALLHLSGTSPFIRFTDTVDSTHHAHIGHSDNSIFVIDADAANTHAGSGIQFKVDNSNVMFLKDGGKVGIGTTSPSTKLHVVDSISAGGEGVITATDSSSNDFGVGLAIRKTTTTTSSSQRFIQFFANGVTQPMGGIVGNGAEQAQFLQLSDERCKKNIKPLSGILDKVNKLKTVSFDWKHINESVEAGFIAQNVQELFPEYVVKNIANEGEEEKMGTTGGMTGGFIAVLTAAIQELSAKVEALEAA